MFVLAKGDLRGDAKDAAVGGHEKWFDVPAVFAVVDLSKLLPYRTVFDFFDDAFEHYGFVGFLRADDNVRVGGDVLCFASSRASAEPKSILPPDSPDKHEMGAAIGTRGGNPVVVGFFQALESPGPGLETT